MGWPFVKRRMAAELGPDWQRRFASFEREAASAASLGQVHKAVGHDGRQLACKLQYPDMMSAVEADLSQLNLIFSIYERYDRAISTKQIHAEISARLREELDYALEARHTALYRDILSPVDGVQVPDVVADLSTKRLLTMTWLEGRKILDYVARPSTAPQRACAEHVPRLVHAVLHLRRDPRRPASGQLHGRPDASINLLDFGCIRVFKPSFVKGVIDLYHALQTDDRDLAAEAYRIWGFNKINNELIDILNVWARFVYAPIMDDRARRIDETNSAMYGREAAEKVHRSLHEVGGLEIPREFVFMDRAAIGLGSVFLHLKAEVNWYQLFHDLVRDFDVDALEKRQTELAEPPWGAAAGMITDM